MYDAMNAEVWKRVEAMEAAIRANTHKSPETVLPVGKIGYADKLKVELVPIAGIQADARALTFGANKYSAWGWTKAVEAGTLTMMMSYGALLRHLLLYVGGENVDEESGLSHLDHAGANLKFLQWMEANGVGDDR